MVNFKSVTRNQSKNEIFKNIIPNTKAYYSIHLRNNLPNLPSGLYNHNGLWDTTKEFRRTGEFRFGRPVF